MEDYLGVAQWVKYKVGKSLMRSTCFVTDPTIANAVLEKFCRTCTNNEKYQFSATTGCSNRSQKKIKISFTR